MPEWSQSQRRAVERIERLGREPAASRALRSALLGEIARHVDFDAYAWLLTDPESEVGSDPLADVPCLPELSRLIRLKYATPTNRWTHLDSAVARLHADTDGHPEHSLVWREMLADYGVTDVASVVFRDRFGCWGFLDLWRTGSGRLFSADDAGYLAAVAPAVTESLRRCQAATFSTPGSVDVSQGPVVLMLSADLQVKAQTAETEILLHALIPTDENRRAVPAGAYNVGAQLLACEAGIDTHPPRARVHLPQGSWLSLSAGRMAGSGSRSDSADIAVTIEAASPAQRMTLFSRAHGLSPRETELLTALARGSDTRQLSSDLFVSQNTIQDHLKSIFVKTGTRNRRALMSRALGS